MWRLEHVAPRLVLLSGCELKPVGVGESGARPKAALRDSTRARDSVRAECASSPSLVQISGVVRQRGRARLGPERLARELDEPRVGRSLACLEGLKNLDG